jgi:hypothetical protein
MIKSGKEIEIPYMDVDIKTGRILNHEGRHRALAAFQLGIKQIPVILYFKEKYGDSYEYVDISNRDIPSVGELKHQR